MDYTEQIKESAEINFERFKQEQLKKSKVGIFSNSFQINFYSTIYDYLLYGIEELKTETCKVLCDDGDRVIDVLYKGYLDMPSASIDSFADIANFINDSCSDCGELRDLSPSEM